MIGLLWKKAASDLWLSLERTLLVILAIAVGDFGVGFVVDAYSIVTRQVEANIRASRPSSAALWMERVDPGAITLAKSFPGVADAEAARSPVRGRLLVGPDEWTVLQLFVVEDFNDLRIGKFFPIAGKWPPADRELLLERSSMAMVKRSVGEKVVIKTLDGQAVEVPITGSVWDPGQDPSWVSRMAYGYVTRATLEWLGRPSSYNSGLRIVAENFDGGRPRVRELANGLASFLEKAGYPVRRIEAPVPGRYIQADRVASVLSLFEVFGLLSLILSALLSATLISVVLSRQVREIGILKAIGGTSRQIRAIYFGTVLFQATLALLLAIPLGILAGRSLAVPTMDWLNFRLVDAGVPVWALAVQIGLGLFVPLFAAAFPVFKGSRITVREAIADCGVSPGGFGATRFDRLLSALPGLAAPAALSLRNAFRRRGRLLLAVGLLAAAGAAFISTLGSAVSWNRAIDRTFSTAAYDIDIRFARPYAAASIEEAVRSVPGVRRAEAWGYSMSAAFPKYSDGTYGGTTVVVAPPENTELIHPVMTEGRWLRPGDDDAIVVDTVFADTANRQGTPVKVGDRFGFSLNGRDTNWRIVGITDKIGLQSSVYVSNRGFESATSQPSMAMAARVALEQRDRVTQRGVSKALERELARRGLVVFATQGLAAARQIMVQHVVIIMVTLMLMSVLIAIVGGLAMASVISMNVMERTREIGILRSLGASSGMIIRMVVFESVGVGVISWVVAAGLSVPLTGVIARNTGKFIFPQVMDTVVPWWAVVSWLGCVIIIGFVASVSTAIQAARLTVRETLAYE